MKYLNRIGEKHISNQGYEIEILEYFSATDITILLDNKYIYKKLKYGNIKNGKVYNPYHKSVYNVGYLGKGRHKIYNDDGSKNHYYRKWENMLERVCTERNPTYKDVTVCEEWKCFQVFAEWVEQNYNPETMQGWHLDKDILVKGNKVYSPDTCCFVPHEINTILNSSKARRKTGLIGVRKQVTGYSSLFTIKGKQTSEFFNTIEEAFQSYKNKKENYIKEVADKWKGLISDKVYEAIYNYQVEITD